MTNSEIVKCIHRDYDKEITNYIRSKLYNKQYCDDLKQDVYVKLLTLNNELLYGLYFTTGVMFYIKRIILNQFNYSKSIFHKTKNISNDLLVPEYTDETDDENYVPSKVDIRLGIIEDILDEQDFFIQLYKYVLIHGMALYNIEDDLNITKRTLRYKFSLIRDRIKKEIEKYEQE